jgi:hypothetical protein
MISLSSKQQMYLESTHNTVSGKASSDMKLESGANMNIKGATTIKETASNIYMNTSGQAAASADSALTATSAEISVLAWVPETMELLSIDLPNPNPASGYAVTSLALNINEVAGYGGENIRNLHDTIVDMQSGVSAYVTKTYPATSGTKSYEADQNAYVATGETTYEMEDPWNGYKQQVEKQEPLGKVNTVNERFTPKASPC